MPIPGNPFGQKQNGAQNKRLRKLPPAWLYWHVYLQMKKQHKPTALCHYINVLQILMPS